MEWLGDFPFPVPDYVLNEQRNWFKTERGLDFRRWVAKLPTPPKKLIGPFKPENLTINPARPHLASSLSSSNYL
jgi:hypothetical protein